MRHDPPTVVEHRVGEPGRVPWLSLALGYGAMLPFPAAAVAAWLGRPEATEWAILWGGLLLCFLGGVRRGLSFRTVGGATVSQLAVSFWLFAAGVAALAFPWPAAAMIVMIGGFGSLIWLDPDAAWRGEVPLYFARLRPWQMAIPVASLLALIALGG